MTEPLQRPERDQQLTHGFSEGRPAPPGDDARELHVREVIYRQGGNHFRCSCGYVSPELGLRYHAEFWECPIEVLLAESAERLRRLIE